MTVLTNILPKALPAAGFVAWPYIDTLYDYVKFLGTGAPIATLPQAKWGTQVAVIGLDIEAIQKMSSVFNFRPVARLLEPTADKCNTWSRSATSMTAPEISPWSTKGCTAAGTPANLSAAGAVSAAAKVAANRVRCFMVV